MEAKYPSTLGAKAEEHVLVATAAAKTYRDAPDNLIFVARMAIVLKSGSAFGSTLNRPYAHSGV